MPITAAQAADRGLNAIEPFGGGLRLRHPRHSASFTNEGISFAPRRGGPVWNWRLTHVGGGTETLAEVRQGPVSPVADRAGVVRFPRGGLIERYVARTDGVEQQFVVPAPLPLNGADLVIAGAVESAGAFEAADRGWLWRSAAGAVTLGGVTVYDSAGRKLAATMTVTPNSTRIVVDGTALAAAAYPVVVDPLIGSNFRISEIADVDLDLDRDAIHSAVAYNPAAMEYLVVWEGDGLEDDTTSTPPTDNDDLDEIFGRRVDAVTGMVLGSDFRISNMSDDPARGQGANPAVAYNAVANEYLVVWQGGEANQDEIFGQRLNAAGGEAGGDFQISDASGNTDPRDASNPAVAYNSTDNEYLVAWQDGTGNIDEILGQRVAPSGALTGTEVAISDIAGTGVDRSAANPALAYNSDANNYLVVWEGNGLISDPSAEAIFGQVVLADGTPVLVSDIEIAPSRASRPGVAYNSIDDEHLVVFQTDNVLSSEIFGQRVDPAGLPVGSSFRISDATQARGPAVAHGSGNNQYLVVWQNDLGGLQHEVFGRLVSGPGDRLGSGDLRISSTIQDAGADRDSALPAVAFDDMENLFLVTYQADGLPNVGVGDDNDDVTEIFGQFAEPVFPNLRLFKDDGGVTVMSGDTIAYMLDFDNIGDGPAPNAVITETVPAHTTFNSGASDPGWICMPDGNPGATCTIPLDTVESGDSGGVVFAVIVDVPLPSGVSEISNSASIADDATGGGDENPADNAASDATPVDAAPDLVITKNDGGVSVTPGETIGYALTVANLGDQDAVGVAISETVPVGTFFNGAASSDGWACTPDGGAGSVCVLSIGDLAADDTVAATFAVTLDATVPAGLDEIVNTATAADDGSNGDDLNPADNSAGDTTPVDAAPDLQLAKDDGGAAVPPGGDVVYTLDFANGGDQGAVNVAIAETVPANTIFNAAAGSPGWTCTPDGGAGSTCTLSLGDLAAGDSGSVDFAVTVVDPLPGGVVETINTAVIADDGANGADPNPADNQASDTTTIGAPDLTIAKDDGGISAVPGDTVAYTLSVANVGNLDATGVTITDVVPANTTFDAAGSSPGWVCTPDGGAGATCILALGSLAAGGTTSAGFAVTLDPSVPAGVDAISNSASVADDGANGVDRNPADNTAGDATPVVAAPDFRITKNDGGVLAVPGDTVVYLLDFANRGDQGAVNVVLSETVPGNTSFDAASSTAGWVCLPDGNAGATCTLAVGGLAAGGAGSANFAVAVDNPVPAGVVSIGNTVAIADDGANGADPNPADNQASVTTPVGAPDLVITKDDGGVRAFPEGRVVYTLDFENAGLRPASGVVLTETVPANTRFVRRRSTPGWVCAPNRRAGATCTLAVGDLPAGAASSADFAVRLREELPRGTTEIVNTVTIGDDGTNGADANPADNTASDTTPVIRDDDDDDDDEEDGDNDEDGDSDQDLD